MEREWGMSGGGVGWGGVGWEGDCSDCPVTLDGNY